jgi:hypothetical protein
LGGKAWEGAQLRKQNIIIPFQVQSFQLTTGISSGRYQDKGQGIPKIRAHTFPEGIADGRPEFWECPVPRGALQGHKAKQLDGNDS